MTQDKSGSRGGQGAMTPGSSQSASGTSSGSSVTDQAKEAAKQAAGQAKEQVSDLTSQAKEQVGTRLSGQKDRVAESLGGVASMLRQTSGSMRDQDQMGLTGFVDQAASQVENFSNYLRENDMGRLVDDVERYARREPAIFLGGAFLLGLLGARFMKSSRPRPSYDERYYGSSSAYQTGNRPYYSGYMSESDYASGSYASPGYTGTGQGYNTGTGSTGMGNTGTGSVGGSGSSSGNQGSRGGKGIYDNDQEGT